MNEEKQICEYCNKETDKKLTAYYVGERFIIYVCKECFLKLKTMEEDTKSERD